MPAHPVWNVAHRINEIELIPPAVDAGANGIECDVMSFEGSFLVHHFEGWEKIGIGRKEALRNAPHLPDWLAAVAPHAALGRIGLLYLDYKGEDFSSLAGQRLAAVLRDAGLPGLGMRTIVSTARFENRAFFLGMAPEPWLLPQVDQGANPTQAASFFRERGHRCFYSDGDGLTDRVVESTRVAVGLRDARSLAGVGVWTLDDPAAMQASLQLGVDVIVTNQPARLSTLLQGPLAANHRLAAKGDIA